MAFIRTGTRPHGVSCSSCFPAHLRSKPAMGRSTDAAAVKCSSPTMSAVAAIALARSAARPGCFSCICRPKPLSAVNRRLSETTIAYYDRFARAFWDGRRHHDVSQNYAAFLDAIEGDTPYSILDLGCGPGRDLSHFRCLGHEAIGLDGSRQFVAMARAHSGCEVLHQDLLALQLPAGRLTGFEHLRMVAALVVDADQLVEHQIGEHPRRIDRRDDRVEHLQLGVERRPHDLVVGLPCAR